MTMGLDRVGEGCRFKIWQGALSCMMTMGLDRVGEGCRLKIWQGASSRTMTIESYRALNSGGKLLANKGRESEGSLTNSFFPPPCNLLLMMASKEVVRYSRAGGRVPASAQPNILSPRKLLVESKEGRREAKNWLRVSLCWLEGAPTTGIGLWLMMLLMKSRWLLVHDQLG